ncbi:MAG: RNA polymerase factor sigma-54 [Candidatus Omnitrophica bacterium]|nr:RNA polymerase factor sigma-54 [Candidatus Omnitrophota bacterium]
MLRQKLLQKQMQKMILSLKMQQSMHILQLPVIELDQLLEQAIAENPVLEEIPGSSADDASHAEPEAPAPDSPDINQASARELEWLNEETVWSSEELDRSRINADEEKYEFQQSLLSKPTSLSDDLIRQFRLSHDNPLTIAIAEYIIGNINYNGYLGCSLEEIAQALHTPIDTVAAVLTLVQRLEPAGIGARDLRECLLLQLDRQGKNNSPEAQLIRTYLQELAEKQYAQISKAVNMPISLIKEYAEHIAALDPKPCRMYSPDALRIVPDVILEKTPGGFDITVNSEPLPQVRINQLYKKMLKEKSCPAETLNFIKEKLKTAQYLIDGISQRQHTLERVTRCIIETQQDALIDGTFEIKPLTLRDIAEKINMHPSTISRTVANKYIQTPYGTVPLKRFFSQAVATAHGDISNEKIKTALTEIIMSEPAEKPFSDETIVQKLNAHGMKISRRTVTKYRLALNIPPAHARRQRRKQNAG